MTDPKAEETVQVIDCTEGIGGGQIFRNSCSIAALINTPVQLTGIRSKRPKPGIQEQHRCGLDLANRVTHGRVEGNEIGSMVAKFFPGPIRGGDYNVRINTAGSISLLIQTILPISAFADSPIRFRSTGGTDVGFSPTIDFVKNVVFPNMVHFGIRPDVNVLKRGFYPSGNGEIEASFAPVKNIAAVEIMEPGDITEIQINVVVGGRSDLELGHHIAQVASKSFKKFNRVLAEPKVAKENGGQGYSITIVAKTSTKCVLGACGSISKKENPATVAKEVGDSLAEQLKDRIAIDEHTQDQMIIFMSIASGQSKILTGPISEHTATSIALCSRLTGARFNIVPLEGRRNIIECHGIGLRNTQLQQTE